MRTRNFSIATGILAIGMCCAAESAHAQGEAPQVVNTRLEVRGAGPNLAVAMKEMVDSADSPMWIGYGVDALPGEHGECCENYREGNNGKSNGVWHLENEHWNGSGGPHQESAVKLEGGGVLQILFRADKRHIERIRMMPDQCQLDAGGLRLIWLKEVKAEQSVAFLTEFVRGQTPSGKRENGIGESALTAIALHASAAADRALEVFAAPAQPESLRERASFWMGAARGAPGLAALEKMARTDSSSDVRAQVNFALFVSKEPGATQEMIRMAREDGSPHVRGQALFWLAQKAGAKAENAIVGAITNDPDTEVKKKAVFALSQMPKDEGVPKLIEVAEKNKNLEVRKQAMFWLGQSEDPRALAFFERVLRN
jgi:HEAT repeat protein